MNPARLDCAHQLTCGPSPSPVWKPPGARERSAVSPPPQSSRATLHFPRAVTPRESPRPTSVGDASPPARGASSLDDGSPPRSAASATSPAHSASSRSTEHSARRLLLSPSLPRSTAIPLPPFHFSPRTDETRRHRLPPLT